MNYLLYKQKYPLVLRRFYKWIPISKNLDFLEWDYPTLKELYDEFLDGFGIKIDEGTNGYSLNYLIVFRSKLLNDLFARDPNISGEHSSWEEPYEHAFQILQIYLKLHENEH